MRTNVSPTELVNRALRLRHDDDATRVRRTRVSEDEDRMCQDGIRHIRRKMDRNSASEARLDVRMRGWPIPGVPRALLSAAQHPEMDPSDMFVM